MISICVPVLCRPKQLFDALCSILLQDFDDVELVIQDGDPQHPVVSDDRIAGILEFFKNVKYTNEVDRGIFDGVNRCLSRSRGEVLYFLCDDDLLCPGALLAVDEIFKRERFGGPKWIYGQTISAHVSGRSQGIDGKLTTYDEMLARNRLGQPAVFWNRALMSLAGKFDVRYRYAADYDLWLRFWKFCEPEYVPQTFGVFRHHEGQATSNSSEVEREAAAISWRHREIGDVLIRTRLKQNYGYPYPDGIPESKN